jgi:hypothetical protein
MAQPASTVEVPLGAAEPGAIVFREFVGMEGIPNEDGAATPSYNRLPIMPTLRQGARMAHSSSPAGPQVTRREISANAFRNFLLEYEL